MSLRLVLRATLLSTVVVKSGHPAENGLVIVNELRDS